MPVIEEIKVRKSRSPLEIVDILSRVIDVSELENPYLKCMFYGEGGVGKTTLACTFPKPLLLISFEPSPSGGAQSVMNVPGVKYLRITSLRDAMNLVKQLKKDRVYKTHILDGGTSLEALALKEVLNVEDIPTDLRWGTVDMDQYGDRTAKALAVIQPFIPLEAHTVILGKEKDHTKREGRGNRSLKKVEKEDGYYSIGMGRGAAEWVSDACDYVARYCVVPETKIVTRKKKLTDGKVKEVQEEIETGEQLRRLFIKPTDRFSARFRVSNWRGMPDYIDNPDYTKIMEVINKTS